MTFLPDSILATATPPADAARDALILFLIVVTVLGLFLVGLVLVLAARRARRQRPEPASKKPLPDPWHEAAERIQPITEDEIRE